MGAQFNQAYPIPKQGQASAADAIDDIIFNVDMECPDLGLRAVGEALRTTIESSSTVGPFRFQWENSGATAAVVLAGTFSVVTYKTGPVRMFGGTLTIWVADGHCLG